MIEPWVAVNADDITSRWRPLTEAETAIIGKLIADAQDILEEDAEVAGLSPVADDDSRRARSYKRIVAGMVKRVLTNPEGILSFAETIDDYRREYRRDAAVSRGDLYVSDDELARLRPAEARRSRGAFSIFPR